MTRRQTSLPSRWLITDARLGDLDAVLRALPRGTGVLVRHHDLNSGARARLLRRLRRIGRQRGLVIVDEAVGQVFRVHDVREIGRARLAGADALLLSPLFPTRSHPDARPLPRMRAATLVGLARLPVVALGGMTDARFARIRALGFDGWAGIDAFLKQ